MVLQEDCVCSLGMLLLPVDITIIIIKTIQIIIMQYELCKENNLKHSYLHLLSLTSVTWLENDFVFEKQAFSTASLRRLIWYSNKGKWAKKKPWRALWKKKIPNTSYSQRIHPTVMNIVYVQSNNSNVIQEKREQPDYWNSSLQSVTSHRECDRSTCKAT